MNNEQFEEPLTIIFHVRCECDMDDTVFDIWYRTMRLSLPGMVKIKNKFITTSPQRKIINLETTATSFEIYDFQALFESYGIDTGYGEYIDQKNPFIHNDRMETLNVYGGNSEKPLETKKYWVGGDSGKWPDQTGWHTVHPYKELEDFVDKVMYGKSASVPASTDNLFDDQVNVKESAINPNWNPYEEIDEETRKKQLDALWEEFKKPNTIEPPKNEAEEVWKKYINDKEDKKDG